MTRRDDRLDDEIRHHLDLLAADYEARGMSPEEARYAARRAFGGVEPMKEQHRDWRGLRWLDDVRRDVRHALRALVRSPGFTAVAVLTLALGIGTNTALFGVVYGYLFAPSPVRDPDSLVSLRWAGENAFRQVSLEQAYVAGRENGQTGGTFPIGVFRELQAGTPALSGVAAFAAGGTVNLEADGVADSATSQFVSGEFFDLLGIAPARGRLIGRADDASASAAVAVLSHQYWMSRFDGDVGILGKSIVVNGVPFTVAGVASSSFRDLSKRGFPGPPDVSIPLVHEPRVRGASAFLDNQAAWWLTIVGRRVPGATMPQAEASLDGVLGRAIAVYSPTLTAEQLSRVPRVRVVAADRGLADSTETVTTRLRLLATVSVIVLLVVCVNVASLLLSRAVGRSREIALRKAIGATRGRLWTQLIAEALVLAGISGVAAVALAAAASAAFGAIVGEGVRASVLSGPTLAFAGVLAAATAVVFGAIPAVRLIGGGLADVVRDTASTSAPRARLGKTLLVLQVALSLPLLFAAGLFLRTLGNLRAVDVGFDPANIVLFTLEPELRGYDRAQAAALYDRVREQLLRVPGVRAVATSGFGSTLMDGGTVVMGMAAADDGRAATPMLVVDPAYFSAIGLPLRSGRLFNASDTPASAPVAVVNEAFVRQRLAPGEPIGQRFRAGFEMQVIGVVADARVHGLREPPPPTIYRVLTQLALPGRRVIVRTAIDATALIPAVREAVRAVEPNLPLQELSTQADTIEAKYLTSERLFAGASTAVGSLVVVVTMIGLFGLMSYTVARRRQEFGVRLALGAQRGQVLTSVLREAVTIAAAGTGAGIVLALVMGRALETQIFGLSRHDPLSLSMASLLMLAAAVAAAAIPALRAAAVDPVIALRSE